MTKNKTEAVAEAAAASPSGADLNPAGEDGAQAADEIVARLAQLETEVAELKDAWLRAKAETDNVRKQAQTDVAKAHKYAIERFAEDLLPVKDALEQTLSAGEVSLDTLKSGSELTLKALRSAFERAQVAEIAPTGEKFDPHRHQAMQMVDSDQAPNTVVNVFQKGYLINDRVLRPALVTVAKAKGEAA
jgi:molecular chaperone GrpE